jgi:hypothetical protein
MVGEVLIPSDLGLAHTNVRPPPHENSSVAYLPVLVAGSPLRAAGRTAGEGVRATTAGEGGRATTAGDRGRATAGTDVLSGIGSGGGGGGGSGSGWYRWNTTVQHAGGQTIEETLGLADMAVFVRPGAVLPLQADPPSGPIQHTADAGGRIEVQVYAGADGIFVMVEDDGISYNYVADPAGACGRAGERACGRACGRACKRECGCVGVRADVRVGVGVGVRSRFVKRCVEPSRFQAEDV